MVVAAGCQNVEKFPDISSNQGAQTYYMDCDDANHCVERACDAGRLNCNQESSDGCEINIADAHLMDCKDKVPLCMPGFLDCDGILANGCETVDNHIKACGGNAIAACDDGYLDCDGDIANGCETVDNHVKACAGNAISACDDGYLDCDGILANGCETAGKSCGGEPGTQCDVGYLDCDGDAANGCEVALVNTNPAVVACRNGKLVCEEGYMDCDGRLDTGCEIHAAHPDIAIMGCENNIPLGCRDGALDCYGALGKPFPPFTNDLNDYLSVCSCPGSAPSAWLYGSCDLNPQLHCHACKKEGDVYCVPKNGKYVKKVCTPIENEPFDHEMLYLWEGNTVCNDSACMDCE